MSIERKYDRMVIMFNVKNVRDYLLDHGTVFTLRSAYHQGTESAVYYDHGWKNLGKVECEFIEFISSPEELDAYEKDSGFGSPIEWFELAYKVHKKIPLMLYKVTLVR
jgi:hypothetical protein